MTGGNTNTARDTSDESSEPSMDEILASIKQIIADDDVPADGAHPRDLYTHPTDPSNSNSTDLHSAMEAELASGMAADFGATPLSQDEQVAVARMRNQLREEGVPTAPQLDVGKAVDVTAAAAAIRASLGPTSAPIPQAPAPTPDAVTAEIARTLMAEREHEIESMLSDLMRPTIRKWLSENLPGIVEKLVREEIESVSRRRRDDD